MVVNKIKLKIPVYKISILQDKTIAAINSFNYENITQQGNIYVSSDDNDENSEILWQSDVTTYEPEYIGLNIIANTPPLSIGWKVHIGIDDSKPNNLATAWNIVMEVAVKYKILSLKVVGKSRFLSTTDPAQCGKQITVYCENQLNECSFLVKDQAYLDQIKSKFDSARKSRYAKPLSELNNTNNIKADYSYLQVGNKFYYISWRENEIEEITNNGSLQFAGIVSGTILNEKQLMAIQEATGHIQLDCLPWGTILAEIERKLRENNIEPSPLSPGERAITGSSFISVRNDKNEGRYLRGSRNYNSGNEKDPFADLDFSQAGVFSFTKESTQKIPGTDNLSFIPPSKILENYSDDFMRFKVPGDGNCFFYAVEHQLKLIGYPKTYSHQDLRALTIKHMEDNINEYHDILARDEHINESIDQYLQRMKKDKEWAGDPEIKAVAAALGLQLKLSQPGDYQPTYGNAKSQWVIHLDYNGEYRNNGHYDSLISKERLAQNNQQAVTEAIDLTAMPYKSRPAYHYENHTTIERRVKLFKGNLFIPNLPSLTGSLQDTLIYQLSNNQEKEENGTKIAEIQKLSSANEVSPNFNSLADALGYRLKVFSSVDGTSQDFSPTLTEASSGEPREIPVISIIKIGDYYYPLVQSQGSPQNTMDIAEPPTSGNCCNCIIL